MNEKLHQKYLDEINGNTNDWHLPHNEFEFPVSPKNPPDKLSIIHKAMALKLALEHGRKKK